MSMTLTAKAMQLKVGSPVRKLILLKLADQANDKGECWPSYDTIAEAAECTRRAVMDNINTLQKMGFLQVAKRQKSNGENMTNIYHLTLDNGNYSDKKGSESGSLGSESGSLGSESGSLGSESGSLGGSESGSPKPINYNQSINQSINHSSADADAPPCVPSENRDDCKPEKPKRTKRDDEDLALLARYGICGQLAEDHLQIRKAKRQPLTETAMRLLEKEAVKCGMTACQAVEYATGNGWASFRAEYLQNKTFQHAAPAIVPQQHKPSATFQTAAVLEAEKQRILHMIENGELQ
ncbi:helix-turn-helix domain-containing protein [Neisseria sp. Dent CA1/247]|uniref:helix-turn-helix domain-containing protein n=1 Tax=Neisseria sp. Dent CA1/247 TaxID=2912675 RepID=UPI001FD27ECD|nr:helix-turn-helix domain-containing protein [Neisseria sp. Dent CA1/247]UOO77949.1 helix-turn-helix domain-containing protein [Neisseria sp. Dent CA1/247]